VDHSARHWHIIGSQDGQEVASGSHTVQHYGFAKGTCEPELLFEDVSLMPSLVSVPCPHIVQADLAERV